MFAWTPAEPSSGGAAVRRPDARRRSARSGRARCRATSGVAPRGLRPCGRRCPAAARIARVPPAWPDREGARAGDPSSPYRAPLDWERLLDWLSARAVPGLESVEDETYRRVSRGRRRGGDRARRRTGCACAGASIAARSGGCSTSTMTPRDLPPRWPGTRCSVRGSHARPASACPAPGVASSSRCGPSSGSRSASPGRGARRRSSSTGSAHPPPCPPGLTHRFPTPQAVADGPLPGMPRTRERALRALAAAVAGGLRLDPPPIRPTRDCAAGAAGHRPLDRRLRRDARAARSRRVAGRGPVAATGRGRRRPGRMAALARLCRDAALADVSDRGQLELPRPVEPPASRRVLHGWMDRR